MGKQYFQSGVPEALGRTSASRWTLHHPQLCTHCPGPRIAGLTTVWLNKPALEPSGLRNASPFTEELQVPGQFTSPVKTSASPSAKSQLWSSPSRCTTDHSAQPRANTKEKADLVLIGRHQSSCAQETIKPNSVQKTKNARSRDSEISRR